MKIVQGISIIISAYNAEKYIFDTIHSIYDQMWIKKNDNFEVIIGIDGCANTKKEVLKFRDSFKNLKIIFLENNVGTYVTLNTLIKISKYDVIIRFDSDDIMLPNYIEETLEMLNTCDLVSSKFEIMVENTKYVPYDNTGNAAGAISFKKHILKHLGGFRNWRMSADSEFLARFDNLAKNKRFKRKNAPNVMFKYRVHPNSLTNSNKSNNKSLIRQKYKIEIENVKLIGTTYVKPIVSSFTVL